MRPRLVISWLALLGGAWLLFDAARSLYWIWREPDPVPIVELPSPATPAIEVPPGTALAKLLVPRLGIDVTIREGAARDILRRGPGHVEKTAFPGMKGNSVIAAHRDGHFRPLKEIQIGDEIWVENGTRVRYVVKETRIVPPSEVSVLDPMPGRWITLITCYPFYWIGHAPKRFVVRAQAEQPPAYKRSSRVSASPKRSALIPIRSKIER